MNFQQIIEYIPDTVKDTMLNDLKKYKAFITAIGDIDNHSVRRIIPILTYDIEVHPSDGSVEVSVSMDKPLSGLVFRTHDGDTYDDYDNNDNPDYIVTIYINEFITYLEA